MGNKKNKKGGPKKQMTTGDRQRLRQFNLGRSWFNQVEDTPVPANTPAVDAANVDPPVALPSTSAYKEGGEEEGDPLAVEMGLLLKSKLSFRDKSASEKKVLLFL